MNLEERIESFVALGDILQKVIAHEDGVYSEQLNVLIDNQYKLNPWFTPDNVRVAVNAIATRLTRENLIKWTDNYPALMEDNIPLRAGVIMAGNIPLAGFHDFLSVLISGNILLAKPSSKDSELIIKIGEILCAINPGFSERIEFARDHLADFDVIIATGSNNSSRYFDYYFNKYPNIIRKNRNSIAIIEEDQTDSELRCLGSDIFLYFGLGCRSVSKIYVPGGYNLSEMTKNWDGNAGVTGHPKYASNYDFNKAVYLVNKEKFFDTGYLLLKEDNGLSSPVSVLYYEYYDSLNQLMQQIETMKEKIQCIAGRHFTHFGKTQSPHLWDYADGIDTIEFLSKKKKAGIS